MPEVTTRAQQLRAAAQTLNTRRDSDAPRSPLTAEQVRRLFRRKPTTETSS